MSSIYDACFLVHFDKSYIPCIKESLPEGTELGYDAIYFCSTCWPFPEEKINMSKIPLVYSFNINQVFYHCLLFIFEDEPYAILINTRRPYASLLGTFLKEVKKQFLLTGVPEPTNAFAYVTSMLTTWPRGAVESAVLTFPTSSLAINFDIAHFSYMQYNPLKFFTGDEISKLWRAVLTGSPVLILSQSADICCKACFAAFSLITPLLYDDNCVIWLQKSDPRYKAVMDGDTSFKIVGSSYNELAKCKQFNVVVNIKTVKKSTPADEMNLHDHMSKHTSKILKMILAELDMILSIDPYSDFVDRPFATEHFREILKEFGSPDMPTFEDFVAFEKTDTFKRWRHAQAMRDILRHALLSYSPPDNFRERSPEDLMKIIEGIESMKVKFWNDAHVVAVLKSHETRVEKLIKKNLNKN